MALIRGGRLQPGQAPDLSHLVQRESVEPRPATTLTPLAFRDRFTDVEKVAFSRAADVNDAVLLVKEEFFAAQEIDLTSPRTIGGLQILVDAGVITVARRDELLAP